MARFWLSIVLLVATVTALLSQQFYTPAGGSQQLAISQLQNPPPPATGPYTLTGTVVNGTTGEPISKALVRLNSMAQKMTMTGPDGRFSFENLPEASAMLTAQKPGFFTPQEMGLSSGPIPTVQVGKESTEAKVLLYPTGSITGRVTTTGGDPIEGMILRTAYLRVMNGESHWEERTAASTDSAGVYRLVDLIPGKYLVETTPHPVRILSQGVRPFGENFDLVYPPLYFSGSPDRTSATPIQVYPGQTAEANFSETVTKAYTVSGIIAGASEDRSNISLVDHEGNMISAGASRQGSRFTFHHVPPGDYSISVSATAHNNSTLYGSAPVGVSNADVEGVAVEMQPGVNIPVRLEVESSSATTNTQIPVQLHLAPVQSTAFVKNSLSAFGYSASAFSGGNEQDNNLFQNVMPGTYHVTAGSGGQGYVVSLRSGQTDLVENNLVIANGTTPPPIQAVFHAGGATITGTLKNGQPSSATFVLIVPDNRSPMEIVEFGFGGGQFSFSGLAPGAYHVYTFSSIENLEYRNREVMRKFDNQAVSVNLTENETKQVELSVITEGQPR